VFEDPQRVIQENYLVEDQDEQRYHVIGVTQGLVLVVFVDRSEDDDSEIIRIIFSQKGSPK